MSRAQVRFTVRVAMRIRSLGAAAIVPVFFACGSPSSGEVTESSVASPLIDGTTIVPTPATTIYPNPSGGYWVRALAGSMLCADGSSAATCPATGLDFHLMTELTATELQNIDTYVAAGNANPDGASVVFEGQWTKFIRAAARSKDGCTPTASNGSSTTSRCASTTRAPPRCTRRRTIRSTGARRSGPCSRLRAISSASRWSSAIPPSLGPFFSNSVRRPRQRIRHRHAVDRHEPRRPDGGPAVLAALRSTGEHGAPAPDPKHVIRDHQMSTRGRPDVIRDHDGVIRDHQVSTGGR